jgi:TolB-like protein/tetratricopeptide (TPR) repeat protein
MSFLGELQRRNVVRVAALYVASSWIILQIIATIGSMLDLPAWIGKLALLALGLGLPVALGISWAYELTPDGLRRDSSVPRSESQRQANAHRLNVITLVVAVLAILTVALDRYLPAGNAQRPVATVATEMSADKGAASADATTRAADQPATRIAVLPFANMSSDPEQDFFSDGVTEEILNLLSDVEGLRVTSRTSSFSFKGQTIDLPTIARKLGVSHVVEGSVRRAGDRVRVTAQLIDVATDTHLWSETYERELDDVFAIQADIAGHIARALEITLGADDLASIGQPPTVDIESWQRFLQARYKLRNRKSAADLDDALQLVDSAIARDPNFARPHSLRALALLLRPTWDQGQAAFEAQRSNKPAGQETGVREATISEALAAANRALEIDPGLGEPYAVRALHAQAHNLYAEAYRNFKEAVARAPSDPELHNWYGSFLLEAGYLQAGWAEKQRAGELDPLSPLIAWHLGYAALIVGRPDVIDEYAAKARENGWEGMEPIALQGGGASERGDMDRAEQLWIKALPDRAEQIRMSVRAVKNHRIDAETARMLATLAPYGPPGIGRFAIQGMSRDVDGSLATIEGTLDPASLRKPDGTGGPARSRGGDGIGSVLRADWWMPESAATRRDPRFAELMRAIGLVEFWREFGWPDKCKPVDSSVVCE